MTVRILSRTRATWHQSFREGDKHEFLTHHFEVPNGIINSFSTPAVVKPQPRGKGREHAQVSASITLRFNRATKADLAGEADAQRVSDRSEENIDVESREEETKRWSDPMFDVEFDLVDVLTGGDAANVVESGGYVSIVSHSMAAVQAASSVAKIG